MLKWLKSTPSIVIGTSLLFGLLFWIIHGYFEFLFFHDNLSFLLLEGPETYFESIALKVPPHSLFTRTSFVLGALLGGVLVTIFINQRKKAEAALQSAHDELEQRVAERTSELAETNTTLKQEIQDRKRAESYIKASLIEKEVLLREVHHRVKNNFEIISSLLDMGSMQTGSKNAQDMWEDARNRIYSMALIHSQLYESSRFDRIDMQKHIKALVEHLSNAYGCDQTTIRTTIEPSEVFLSVNQAIPCALVFNELIANTFKHAFRKTGNGTVHVSVSNSTGNAVRMRIRDDGSGFPVSTDSEKAKGLGLNLVEHLVKGQLKGKMSIIHDNGTEIQIEFERSE